mmetsp:Transcript_8976/g.37081  ORF Transcript_8976/g.37081 Transcript_8976/m.37081 type:complete len:152 (+) Transcript_8976:150-605(+)
MTHPNPCFDASTSSWNGLSRSGRRSAGADKPEKRAGADLPNNALSGAATVEKLGTYGRHQPARPKKEWTSVLRMTNGRERRNCARGSTADTTGADTMSDWSSPKGPDRVRVERDLVPLDDTAEVLHAIVPEPALARRQEDLAAATRRQHAT